METRRHVHRKDKFIEKINIDREFIDDVIDKTKPFIKLAILPELVGKRFTKQNVTENEDGTPHDQQPTADQEDEDRWCYCKRSESHGDMIVCDNDQLHRMVSFLLFKDDAKPSAQG